MLSIETLPDQIRFAAERFQQRFGRPPRFAAAAPGRVNLIGEHTDYNDGFVLPMAIERQTVLVADKARDPAAREVRVISMEANRSDAAGDAAHVTGEGEARFKADWLLEPGEPEWSNYVRGVIAGCLRSGLDPAGFDAVVHSTVPVGGGLSSSAAIEVATATLVEAITGHRMSPVQKALLCQQAEHEFPRVPCGIMDQSISVMGQADHAMLLDCRSLSTRMVPLKDPGVTVLIANSNVKHELSGGEYAERRGQCEKAAKVLDVAALRDVSSGQLDAAKGKLDELTFRRARHVVTEIERTQRASRAAESGDWLAFGKLMYESHASLRDDFEVSTPELDALVEIARDLAPDGGVFGARMTGGGFGGCTVSLVKSEAVERVSDRLAHEYRKRTGTDATIFATRPAAGARIVQV
jgi:galactokinase